MTKIFHMIQLSIRAAALKDDREDGHFSVGDAPENRQPPSNDKLYRNHKETFPQINEHQIPSNNTSHKNVCLCLLDSLNCPYKSNFGRVETQLSKPNQIFICCDKVTGFMTSVIAADRLFGKL